MSTVGTSSDQTVYVVITTYNDADFLHEALASVALQQKVPNEILVVDDGSEVSSAPIVALFPQATLIRKPNGGLAGARNAGLKAASAKFITFLDADDKFRSNAITAGLDCFARSPDAAMVYGGHILISADGSPLGGNIYRPASSDPYADLLSGNSIGMHAAVLYRRDILLTVGGFDEVLRLCETTMFTCVSRKSILLLLIQRSWPSIGGTAEKFPGTLHACFVPCSLCTIVTESRQALENRPGAQAGKPGSPGTRLVNERFGMDSRRTRLCIGMDLRAWR